MANAYDALLAQYYTPAHRQQAFFDSLGPLGAGLIAAGAPSTNPAAFAQGISQGLLGMQQTMRQGPQEAFQRAAMASQMATAGLQQQKLQQEMAARARIAALFGGGAPAPSSAGMPMGTPSSPPPTPMPGPISGPPAAPGGPRLAPAGGQPQTAPAAAPSASASTLQDLANRYFQAGAELMAVDPAQGRAFLEMAMQYNPAIKVEMTAAGDLLVRGPDGRYYSAPGVDQAKARRAGLVAGSEAGARNASELRFAGPIAAAREQGKNQGAVSLVTVPGVGPLPGTQAVAQTTEAGKAVGAMTPVASPWGTMPAPQAMETARNFAGQRVETGRPGFQLTEVAPNTGAAPAPDARVQVMPDGRMGMALPPISPPARQSRVVAQNPNPDPQTGAGRLMIGVGEGVADTITKSRDSASTAANSLRTVNEAEKLLNSGVITGTGANFRTSFTRALNTIGIGDGINVANTEAFIATMGRATLDLVEQLGAGSGISNADRDYAEKVAGGNITMSEDGIRKLFDINRRASAELIQRHNSLVDPIINDQRTDPVIANSLRVRMPEIPSTPQATRNGLPTNPEDLGKLSDDEVLRRLGVRR